MNAEVRALLQWCNLYSHELAAAFGKYICHTEIDLAEAVDKNAEWETRCYALEQQVDRLKTDLREAEESRDSKGHLIVKHAIRCKEAEAERDSLRNMLDACEENNAALRAELTTCNQALEAAQARVRALEKVAEAARELIVAPVGDVSTECEVLYKALAALDAKEGDNARD